jgi:hypothetical protein
VTKSETRTLAGLVINQLNAGCSSQLPLPSRKAQFQTLSSHRNGRLRDRVEYLSGALVMMTTASSNQTSHPACSLPRPPMRFFGAADQLSLYFLATWRKGGVQRSGVFRELIGDACHERGPRIRFELQNGHLTGTRNLRRDRASSTWSKIRPPAGFDRCSATSRDRAAHRDPSWRSIPLYNSPLLHRVPVTTHGPLAPTVMFMRKFRLVSAIQRHC